MPSTANPPPAEQQRAAERPHPAGQPPAASRPRRRPTTILLACLVGLLASLLAAAPAAAVTTQQKLTVLSSWTQVSTSSYNAWNSARLNQGAWSAYAFDWSTDYCSDSPDQPLGFDFRLPCWRHDFGYRNYKALGAFSANKTRLDSMFYFDLKAKCATYSIWVRSACYSLAWSYYQAVKTFGSVPATAFSTAESLQRTGLARQARAEAASSHSALQPV